MAPRKPLWQELTAATETVLVGDQVRQNPGDEWVAVDRIDRGSVVIGDQRIETVTLWYGGDRIEQSADTPIEIRRPSAPVEEAIA